LGKERKGKRRVKAEDLIVTKSLSGTITHTGKPLLRWIRTCGADTKNSSLSGANEEGPREFLEGLSCSRYTNTLEPRTFALVCERQES
jgi:hypothetical protein